MWMAIKHHPCHVINIKTYMILSGCGALALYMKKVNCMRIEKYDQLASQGLPRNTSFRSKDSLRKVKDNYIIFHGLHICWLAISIFWLCGFCFLLIPVWVILLGSTCLYSFSHFVSRRSTRAGILNFKTIAMARAQRYILTKIFFDLSAVYIVNGARPCPCPCRALYWKAFESCGASSLYIQFSFNNIKLVASI